LSKQGRAAAATLPAVGELMHQIALLKLKTVPGCMMHLKSGPQFIWRRIEPTGAKKERPWFTWWPLVQGSEG